MNGLQQPIWRAGAFLAVLVVAGDQLAKWLAVEVLSQGGVTYLPGFVDLILVHNVGAAFGILTSAPPVLRLGFLVTASLLAMGLLSHMLYHSRGRLAAVSVGLILGGATGNLVDRVRLGYVIDFIHLHWHQHSWPVFNLADSAISVGVALLLWENFFVREETNLDKGE